jgi:ATP-dependent DNA helicase RecQ
LEQPDRAMLLDTLLRKDIEEYGLLKFTDKGKAWMKKPTSFQIAMNNRFEDANEDDGEYETMVPVAMPQPMKSCLKC